MTEHAIFSASSSDRWMNCPASIKLSRQAPPQLSSKYAEEGSWAHQKCYEALKEFKEKGSYKTVLNDPMRIYVEEVIKNYDPKIDQLLLEHKIDHSWLDRRMWGTADAIIIKEDKAIIYDFKYGINVPVSPVKNSQFMCYALLFLQAFKPYEKLDFVVVQPRCEEVKPVQTWTCSMTDLKSFYEKVKKAIILSERINEVNPGEHCMFCPAKAICPTQKKLVEEVLGDVEKPIRFLPPSELAPEFIKKIITHKNEIEKWLYSVEQFALHHLIQGGKIEGFKLVEKQTRLTWTNEVEAELKFTDDKYYKRQLITPTQMKANFPEKEQELEKLSSRRKGEWTIATESDNRKNEIINIEKMFEGISQHV